MRYERKKPMWPRKLVGLLIFFAIFAALMMLIIFVLGHKQE